MIGRGIFSGRRAVKRAAAQVEAARQAVPVRLHVLEALRANASGTVFTRPDGSRWQSVTFREADVDAGDPRRLAEHVQALGGAGLFEETFPGGGLVRLSAFDRRELDHAALPGDR